MKQILMICLVAFTVNGQPFYQYGATNAIGSSQGYGYVNGVYTHYHSQQYGLNTVVDIDGNGSHVMNRLIPAVWCLHNKGEENND